MELETELSVLKNLKKLLILQLGRREEREKENHFHLHLLHFFTFIALFNTTLKKRYCYSHFIDEKSETQKDWSLSHVAWLFGGGAGICLQLFLTPKSSSLHSAGSFRCVSLPSGFDAVIAWSVNSYRHSICCVSKLSNLGSHQLNENVNVNSEFLLLTGNPFGRKLHVVCLTT